MKRVKYLTLVLDSEYQQCIMLIFPNGMKKNNLIKQ